MSAKSPALERRIAAEIAARGPMRFSRFMELALYDPADGYYASGRASVGRGGDFFTNVSVGPAYGEILAGQFLEMSEILGHPEKFTIVEQGANDGRLARDILEALRAKTPHPPRLTIIEPFAALRQKQEQTLEGFAVEWVASPGELPAFHGVHFSNELFDALPFDLLEAQGGRWHELRVTGTENFAFEKSPEPGEKTNLPDGFRTERRTGQSELLQSIASKMQSGFLLAVDYGMESAELLAPHRSAGTLACFSNHRRDTNPLESPGEKDITAHVDFTALARCAVEAGFELNGYTDQHHFIIGAAEKILCELDGKATDPASQKKLRAIRMLMHPETMGVSFKAIALTKNLPRPAQPTGFRHARDPNFLAKK